MKIIKAFSTCVIATFIISSCTSSGKNNLENSFVVSVSPGELFSSLTLNINDENFQQALKVANEMQLNNNDKTYTELFGEAIEKIAPGTRLSTYFSITLGRAGKIELDSDNAEVLAALQKELDLKIDLNKVGLSTISEYESWRQELGVNINTALSGPRAGQWIGGRTKNKKLYLFFSVSDPLKAKKFILRLLGNYPLLSDANIRIKEKSITWRNRAFI